ncbi:hypothetical protein [Acinetobacter nosocomialis]|uniref:hypothetical protein n=1 Tax=Acinetobacter nosocomialis TaxID=106654 RepID=UPI00057E1F71|nr:hypothetical protein [Acinetobacter nosocomialis]AJB48764.1 hypothetical protein RR32_11775 [Acinetobacter nosocomialis]MBR7739087.1 hypothetical protein [Acinetobacter nosocomialis]MDO7216952.1 hypothetical protein [Acinetobacter nosocomialis]MDO7436910.1 hypothetical protein [Acinetobacter nosocomialis]
MKNKLWKKYKFQTESNKFYSILSDSDFNKEDGVKLNPYINSENLMDKEVVVIQEMDLTDSPCFNIRNTDIGVFLEIYSLNQTDVYIVDNNFNIKDVLELVKKLSQFSYVSALKYIKFKYGFKDQYIFYEN